MEMHMPALADQHRKLHALAGTWIGEETLQPSPWDPKGGPASSRSESRVILDGFYVTCDYVQERGGQVTYRGHGVYGWDPADQSYTMHWFDSMGAPCSAPARGRWEGNRLAFEMRNPMGYSRYTYTFESDKRYRFGIEMSQDGKAWSSFMSGDYARR